MTVKTLTQSEINWLDITIDNGVIVSASITTADAPIQAINMVCFWDSNTEWIELLASEKFATMLDANPDITAFNEGIAGNTSTQLLSRLQTSVLNRKDVNKRNIMTLLIGTNDFWYWFTVNQVWTNIQSIISQVKAQWWEVILMTYPVCDDYNRNPNIRSLNTLILNNTSIGYTAIDVHQLFVSPTNPDANRLEISRTQLHFGWYWHRVISEAIQSVLWYNNYSVPTQALTNVNAQLALWGYQWVSFIDLWSNKGILIAKLNNMFKLWIINYAVVAGAFGGNTSLQTNIQHYWKCDANGSFPDELGTNNGTLNWPTFSASGKISGDYDYDNTNDVTTITALSWTKSVSLWAKKDATGVNWRVMGDAAGTKYLFQFYNDGNNYSNLWTGTMSFAQTDDTNYHHYVVTTDGTNARFYQDGTLKLTSAYTWNLWGFDQIGRYSTTNNAANVWNWHIDEIGCWTKTLSTQDITDLYNSGSWLSY